MCLLWWILLRKIILISKVHRITSLADFIASRYGKSALVAGLVTVIAVIGILPYISLQLKAISTAFTIVHSHDVEVVGADTAGRSSGTPRFTRRSSSPPSPSCSGPATSTPQSGTRGWWRRSPSSRW